MAPASQKLTFRQKRTEEKMNGRSAANFEAEDSSVEEIASESSEEEEDSSSDEFSDCKGNKERTTEKESTQEVSNSSRKASFSKNKPKPHRNIETINKKHTFQRPHKNSESITKKNGKLTASVRTAATSVRSRVEPYKDEERTIKRTIHIPPTAKRATLIVKQSGAANRVLDLYYRKRCEILGKKMYIVIFSNEIQIPPPLIQTTTQRFLKCFSTKFQLFIFQARRQNISPRSPLAVSDRSLAVFSIFHRSFCRSSHRRIQRLLK